MEMSNISLGTANMICYILLKLLSPFIPNTSTKLLNSFTITVTPLKECESNDLTQVFTSDCTITINKNNYSLPFKNLDIKEVKITLNKFNIISSL